MFESIRNKVDRIGDELRQLRIDSGMNASEVERELAKHNILVTRQTILNYEKGTTIPPVNIYWTLKLLYQKVKH